jgi:hypothetical protein
MEFAQLVFDGLAVGADPGVKGDALCTWVHWLVRLAGYGRPFVIKAAMSNVPENCSENVEVAEADVLHYEKTPEGVLPHGAVTVWIKGDADVSVKLDRMADVGRVELRRGRLRIRVPGGGQMQVCQSVCGVCQSVCGVCQSVCGVCQSVCSAELAGPGQLRRPMGRFWR